MGFEGFSAGTLAFLADLSQHNDRSWFAENRARYDSEILGRQRLFESTLVRTPAGFSADAPRADLLRYTLLHAIAKVEPVPPEFYSAAFVDWYMERFVQTKPLVDWLIDNVD